MYLLDTGISWLQQLANSVKYFDQFLFLKINNDWTNSFFDNVIPWWRDSNTWVPLYFFLLLFAFANFGWRVWPWVLFFILTVALTDQLSSTIIKTWIARPRPCSDGEFAYHVRLLLGGCSGGYSFPSSHATNHFGMACFIFYTMRDYFKKWSYVFFLWAATIAYGQVYVGVHYPIDVIGGAIIGSLVGLMTASFFNRRIGLPPLLNEQRIANKEQGILN